MKTSKIAATAVVAALLTLGASPALATQSLAGSNDTGYTSQDLPDVPNAGAAVENGAEGDALLIELYTFTLNDTAATAADKATARQELAKLGVTTKGLASLAAVTAMCPVSIGDSVQASSSGVATAAACENVVPPKSKTLTVTWVQQSNGYYCGPAAALMAIKQRGITTSKDGASKSLTQANLAGSAYLKTTESAGTPWAAKRMHTTLNKWTNTSLWGATNAPSTTSVRATLLKSSFRSSVGVSGRTVLVNAVEFKGGSHYNGHPNRDIGHWMVGYAYSDAAATIKFADPATGLSGYTGKEKFAIATSTFAPYLGNGIVA